MLQQCLSKRLAVRFQPLNVFLRTIELSTERNDTLFRTDNCFAKPAEGFILSVLPGAVASIHNQPVEQAILRNGDVIEVGAVKLQFGLSPTRHRSLRLREVLTWVGLALLCLGQVALIYWLPD